MKAVLVLFDSVDPAACISALWRRSGARRSDHRRSQTVSPLSLSAHYGLAACGRLASAPIGVADGDYSECLAWHNASGSPEVEADPQTWFAIVAIEYAAFRGAMVRLTADASIQDSTDTAVAWDATDYDTDGFWNAGRPTRLTVGGVSRVRLKASVDWWNRTALANTPSKRACSP